MAKKDFFLIVDTETTKDNRVADFGAVVCDRKGKIFDTLAVMVHGQFLVKDLFTDNSNGYFGIKNLKTRTKKYERMLNSGSRVMASNNAINRWLERINGQYNPILTAYNMPFDLGKCNNTEIDLNIFSRSFCLYRSAVNMIAHTKEYKLFCIENDFVTDSGNIKTNADIMTKFVMNDATFEDEPHTALEDAMLYEKVILEYITKRFTKKQYINFKNKGMRIKAK